MQDYGNWKTVYIVIIAFLAGLVLALEVVSWITYPVRKAGRPKDEEATDMVNHPR